MLAQRSKPRCLRFRSVQPLLPHALRPFFLTLPRAQFLCATLLLQGDSTTYFQVVQSFFFFTGFPKRFLLAAAAAKSLQSCPTLCDLIDGSPPGSPVPGILQARTLERVATSLSIKSVLFFYSKPNHLFSHFCMAVNASLLAFPTSNWITSFIRVPHPDPSHRPISHISFHCFPHSQIILSSSYILFFLTKIT